MEYTEDENFDYEKIHKVIRNSPRDEQYFGDPYQLTQTAEYKFNDSITPKQLVNISSHYYRSD